MIGGVVRVFIVPGLFVLVIGVVIVPVIVRAMLMIGGMVMIFIVVFVWMKPLNLPALLSALLVVQILPPVIATRFGA